ncbi:MAG TPA: NfeD family protein [Candidatus Methanomethylicus sp.]|nr:NfeD family protein [Candidatus Methanomethylicus sp.]
MPSLARRLLFISDDVAAVLLTVAVVWELYSSGIIGAGAAIVIGALAVAFFSFVAFKTYRLQAMEPKVGAEVMVGKMGKAVCDLDPEGAVEIEGEYWKAVGVRPVWKGAAVRVVRIDGLKATVVQVEEG